MSLYTKLYIANTGMITAIGANTEMTLDATRAGINRYKESIVHNKQYKPINLALIPESALPEFNEGLENKGLPTRQRRMLKMSEVALTECLANTNFKSPLPLFLAVPEVIPNSINKPMSNKFIDQLSIQAGIEIDIANSRMFELGRAGGFHALDYAFKYLEHTKQDYALLGGIDSYLDLALLSTLDKDQRIRADEVMDGFIGGEAACFILLASERIKELAGKNAYVFKPGLADEEGHRYSDNIYKGDGLDNAFKNALQQADGITVNAIFSSLNGESLSIKECSVASMRNKNLIDENALTEHPADCFGDVGAAFGPLLLALTSLNIKKGHIQAPCLAYSSSDTSYRGAAQVSI